jgi:splicing factor 3B subunit 4
MAAVYGPPVDRNQEATVYVGNLDGGVDEDILGELLLQCGPIVNVFMPRDRVTSTHNGFGFVEFRGEEDAEYAIKIMHGVKLFGKAIRVNRASEDKAKMMDVGANLFIGNLAPEVDERTLKDTFSAFGYLVHDPRIMCDPDTGKSRGFGFVCFGDFEAADSAMANMNAQYLCGKQIRVTYAMREDAKGEKHGTEAERLLAVQLKRKGLSGRPSGSGSGTGTGSGSGSGRRQPSPSMGGSMSSGVAGRPMAPGMMPGMMPGMGMGMMPGMMPGMGMGMGMRGGPPPPWGAAAPPPMQHYMPGSSFQSYQMNK